MNHISKNSFQGRRKTNEDSEFYTIFNDFIAWGVFDGHGGKAISLKLKELIPKYFEKYLNIKLLSNAYECKKIIKNIFNMIKDELSQCHPKAVKFSGSTANICILFTDITDSKQKIININVGDSRTIKGDHNGNTVVLSKDHKPFIAGELKRIKQLGGHIEWDGADWRIKGLSLSRAFGDEDSAPFITHEPDITYNTISPKDSFIVTACDGLWDVVTNEEALSVLHMNADFNNEYAHILTKLAYEKGSGDNITVIVVKLNKPLK